jgi:hypothetical protein
VLFDNLSKVLIRSHHEYLKSVGRCLLRDGADNIICFESFHLKNGDIESANDLFYNRDTGADILRCFLPGGFIVFKQLVPKGRTCGIEGYGNVCRLLLLKYLQQRIGKPEHYGGIHALGVDPRILGEGKMRAVNQGIGIKKKQFWLGSAHKAKIGNQVFRGFAIRPLSSLY